MLYSFSGFSIYNIFFNHFHEAMVFFPLLLAALDEHMATQAPRRLALLATCGVLLLLAPPTYPSLCGQVTFTPC